MSRVNLSVPSILVNDELIYIVPNSFSYDDGEPEVNVRAASGGNGTTESVHSVNAETAISEAMFSVYTNAQNDVRIKTWKRLVGSNTIKALQTVENGDDVVKTFPGQSLTNKVSREGGADGVVALEFKGDQAI